MPEDGTTAPGASGARSADTAGAPDGSTAPREPSAAAGRLLVAEGIRRRFTSFGEQVEVLDGIEMALGASERVVLEGPSGSGKSTLVAILGLIDPGFEGTYRLLGHDVHELEPDRRTAMRLENLGLCLQDPHLLSGVSAVDNAALRAVEAGQEVDRARELARELLDVLGLADRGQADAGELSGGEQRRVGIARAFVTKPEVVLLDEPEAGLDEDAVDRVAELIEDHLDHGGGAVLATHEERLKATADRVLELEP